MVEEGKNQELGAAPYSKLLGSEGRVLRNYGTTHSQQGALLRVHLYRVRGEDELG